MICKVVKDFPNNAGLKVGDLISIKRPEELIRRELVVPMMIVETTIIDAEIVPEEKDKKVESKTKNIQKGEIKIDAKNKNNQGVRIY